MNSKSTFKPGMRVAVILGDDLLEATVVYQRMLGPEYKEVAAVSVRLDKLAHDPRYAGTIVPPDRCIEIIDVEVKHVD